MKLNILKDKIVRFLCTRPFTKKGLKVFRPSMYYVNPQARVSVGNYFNFNKSWDDERMIRNRQVGSLYIAKDASLIIDSFDAYTGCRINVNAGAKLTLGSGYMNHDCVIDCFDSISVGHHVVISERVVLRDSDNHQVCHLSKSGEVSDLPSLTAPIVIEDQVWIGMNVIILKGVTIGEGSIIAAGSVVTRDIPSHCLAAGVPAKVIKSEVTWS